MYNSIINPQMGILVINLPTIYQPVISATIQERALISRFADWEPISKDRMELNQRFKYMPSRILDNLKKDEVKISVVDWEDVVCEGQLTLNCMDNLKSLIHIAYERRFSFNYDHSTPLRRNNS